MKKQINLNQPSYFIEDNSYNQNEQNIVIVQKPNGCSTLIIFVIAFIIGFVFTTILLTK